jgi:hypothetical protein
MLQVSKQMRVMETGDHFKNGASLKSLMSKGKLLSILIAFSFVLISCSEKPTIDGCYHYKHTYSGSMTVNGFTDNYEFCFSLDGTVILKYKNDFYTEYVNKTLKYKVVDVSEKKHKIIYKVKIQIDDISTYLLKFNPNRKEIQSLCQLPGPETFYENEL